MDIKCYIDLDSLVVNMYGEGNIPMAIQSHDTRANIVDLDAGTAEANTRADAAFEDVDHAKEWISASYPDDTIEYVDEVPGLTGEDEEVA
tara:strand:+ start:376 stop:645 length:270 start_codon:yes stop_codon:yes gene_type:complete